MKRIGPWLVLASAALAAGCGRDAQAQDGALSVRVAGVPEGASFPRDFTCTGDDDSPPMVFANVPPEAQSLVLVVDDPDAPRATFTHWLLYDLPPRTELVERDRSKDERLASGGKQGVNDFGRVGWDGPCPPPGRAHCYRFTLYALDEPLELAPGIDRELLERAMEGHVIAADTFRLRFAR